MPARTYQNGNRNIGRFGGGHGGGGGRSVMDRRVGRLLAALVTQHEHKDQMTQYASVGQYSWIRIHANSGDEALESAIRQRAHKLVKQDLFEEEAASSRYFLESPKAWKNFDKLAELLAENGEYFTVDDLKQKPDRRVPYGSMQDEPPVRYILTAAEANALDKVFSAKIWAGRSEEMMQLWQEVPEKYKGQVKIGKVRRDLARKAGTPLREDEINVAGLSLDVILDHARHGKLKELEQKFADAGLQLEKDDLMIMDNNGRTIFDSVDVWRQFDRIQTWLRNRNEAFTADELLQNRRGQDPLLTRASRLGQLRQVFRPENWPGDMESYDKLFRKIRSDEEKSFDYDLIREEVQADAYKLDIPLDRSLTKAKLLRPRRASAGKEKFAPLAKLASWEQFEQIQAFLVARNDGFTLEDLRKKTASDGADFIEIATRHGHFPKLAALARHNKENFLSDDFTKGGTHGRTILEEIIRKDQLSALFQPELWQGRPREMAKLWQDVPLDARAQVSDIKERLRQANISTIWGFDSQNKPKNPKL